MTHDEIRVLAVALALVGICAMWVGFCIWIAKRAPDYMSQFQDEIEDERSQRRRC